MKYFIRITLILLFTYSSSQGQVSHQQVFDRNKLLLEPFNYNQVNLQDSPLKRQLDEVEAYYLAISNEDLLKGFRERAGLPTNGAKDLGGWYTKDFYHVFGQLLAGYSRLYAVSGKEALKIKVNALIEGWAKCIDSNGFFYYTNKPNDPHYIYEKMVGGLVDAYVFAGNKKALNYLSVITDWAIKNLDQKHKTRGNTEWYTLSENLYRAYQVTNDKKYLDFGKVWEYTNYWNIYASKGNIFDKNLPWYHAYSHLNTLSSAAAAYLISGNEKYKATIKNGYDFFQDEECFATGGFGPNEALLSKSDLINALQNTHSTFETQCGSWAIFKLNKYLLEITGDAKYGDWIEKMTINGIGLNVPMTDDGKVLYYSDYNPRAGTKFYYDEGWSCCTGTRPQAVAEYADLVYFKSKEGLYVNLYTPSKIVWNNISITQSTKFPESNETVFAIGLKGSKGQPAKLHFRKPLWVKGEPMVSVNGKVVKSILINNWMQLNRQWEDGDKIKIVFPMSLYVDRLDKSKEYPAAIMYGPVAMAVNVVDEYPADIVQQASILSDFIAVADKPLTYKIKNHPDLMLRPYYQFALNEPYMLYVDPTVKNRLLFKNLIFTGQWQQRERSFSYTNETGASVATNFTGKGIRLFLTGYPDSGIALITMDGKNIDKVDLYSVKEDTSYTKEYKVMEDTKHTIMVSVSGEKNDKSKNTFLSVIRFEILE